MSVGMALPAPSPRSTALVTGASSGIGAEIARELAARGHGVTLVARRADALRELAARLGDDHGVRAEVLPADLTDASARAGLVDGVAGLDLEVSILVNNAGFSTKGPVAQSDPEREIAMVRTDVEAVVDLCSRFLPGMVAAGSGAVLNVASTAAFQPLPGQAAYGASKAFVLSYGHALRGELRGTGVSVTTLCPGPVETEFAEAAGFTQGEAEGALPKFMWVDAPAVAYQAVDGLAGGHSVVIPGLANRVTAYSAYLTPRRILAPVLAKMHPALRNV